jgi:hypothetical protein
LEKRLEEKVRENEELQRQLERVGAASAAQEVRDRDRERSGERQDTQRLAAAAAAELESVLILCANLTLTLTLTLTPPGQCEDIRVGGAGGLVAAQSRRGVAERGSPSCAP